MKKYLSIFAFAIMALVCLSACGNDDDNTPAPPSSPYTGVAKRTGDISVKWVQLWKDGPKFAEYNVGANSVTEDGGHYSWGMNIDKDSEGFYKQGESALTGTDDTATYLWGSNWRMPTWEELQALLDNCDVAWTDNYKNSGKEGRVFTGKGDYASNSVFLPAAARCDYGRVLHSWDFGGALHQGDWGDYWSSTPSDGSSAFCLGFGSGCQDTGPDVRYHGFSVRAVLSE